MPQKNAAARPEAAASKSQALEALRREIDRLDDSILELIEQRVAAAMGVAELKRLDDDGRLRLRPAREAAVIERLVSQAQQSPEPLVRQIWREIMACCLDLQVHTDLLFHADRRPAAVTDAMRRRFGCAGRMIATNTPAEALQGAREREAVAVIELEPDSDWWTELKDDPVLALFECLRDDDGNIIGLAAGRIAGDDLRSCPPLRIVAAGDAWEGKQLAAAGDLRLVLAEQGEDGR